MFSSRNVKETLKKETKDILPNNGGILVPAGSNYMKI